MKASAELKQKFDSFVRSQLRLGTFYHDNIGSDVEFLNLYHIVQLVLTLSHGNASVENGFSENSDFLVENLHEASLVT